MLSSSQSDRVASPLEAFLDAQHYVLPNLNDTFAYACSDSEKIDVGEGEIMEKWWSRHGWHGLVALAAWKRGVHPLDSVATSDGYRAALHDLASHELVACHDDPEAGERWVWWFDLEDCEGVPR